MRFFKWFGALLGSTSDHAGWQTSAPSMPAFEGVRNHGTDSALQIPAVWACINLLSRTVALLPIDVFKVDSKGLKKLDVDSNLHAILARTPNASMTPYEFISTMVLYWCLRGNAYALIERKGSKGDVISLLPLNPDQMMVHLDENGVLVYRYYTKENHYEEYASDKVLHWKAMGNGIMGLSPLSFMLASLNEAIEAQDVALDIFKNKGKLNGILTSASRLNEQQKKEIAQQFQKMRNDRSIPVLQTDLKFQALALSPAETQLLETRRFSVEEICRIYGVPSALVNSDGGASGSNLEQVTANFYRSTILPMCISLEQAIMKKVPSFNERYDHTISFRLSFLNRASDQARANINAQALQNGWKSRNEVRLEEGYDPIQSNNADALTAQSNLVPLDKLGENVSKDESMNTTNPQRQ